ncbi:MAG: M12 family metallopeptidase [Actinomycetota bacterium]|nr:M12 family metallopeptidase [Actinomycetota bacterium]
MMESPYLQVCADKFVEEEERDAAEEVALGERPDNLRVAPAPFSPRSAHTLEAAVEKVKLWDSGRTLRVRFLDGDTTVQAKVAAVAAEWEQHVNLKLQFLNSGDAEIRISFAEKGFSWSYVGTDALVARPAKATMNYGWLDPQTGDREYQRVVLHEFGHALGMIHEHQNPAAGGKIPWDRERVYAYYARQGWSRSDVDHNLFAVYDADATNFSTYDPTSIMQYPVPDELTVGSFAIGWNTALSSTDREFMARQYPAGATGTVDLQVDAPPHDAALDVASELDTYRFQVAEGGTHIMTTTGSTDVVLSLQGPNDPGALVAWDDDRGRGRNARIVRRLESGTYWLTVRHKDSTRTGAYAVGVKRRKG